MSFGRGVVLSGVAWFGASIPALAQSVPPSSDPGRIPQRFERPAQPKALPRTGGITLPSTVPPDDVAHITLTVARVEIFGATILRPRDFADLTGALTGRPVPLSEVYALAARITARYGEAGYVLSRAVIPPQSFDFDGAVVRIEIIEGYVDEVVWPASLERHRNFFKGYTARIVEARPANINVIERYLLLAGDLPGLSFTSTFQPSNTHPKASTLIVTAREKPVDLEAGIDNRGSKGRGPWQAHGAATANNWLGLHESLSLNYATVVPTTEELQFVGGTWRQVLNSEGLTFLFNGSYNTGIPGTLQDLDYDSTGVLFNATLAYPIIRSRDANLTLAGIAFTEDVKSDAVTLRTEDRLRGGRVRLDYDRADALGGINLFQLTASRGIDGLGSTDNDNPDASRRGGKVDFTKIEGLASR